MATAKTIGSTKALIPVAGSSSRPKHLLEGKSGDTDFPHGKFKALATIGEVDKKTGRALTGYPDGNAAWLKDDQTVRVAYQSESYGQISTETYGSKTKSGAQFTGSKIHYIDYDREGFANFLTGGKPASSMVKGSGLIYNKVYNAFGLEVTSKNNNSSDLAAKWGNQTKPTGELIEFNTDYQLQNGDFFFQSFCAAWYEPANKYGEGVGFENDIWLAAEEWNIGNDVFTDPDGKDDPTTATVVEGGPLTGADVANSTLGLASIVVDINSKTLYTVPSLGQTGYERIVPVNPGTTDHVVMVLAGYNHDKEPVPNRIYVGRKGFDAEGNPVDYDNLNKRDSFLARNGLLFGQIYGLALNDKTYEKLGLTPDVNLDGIYNEYLVDEYMKNGSAPNKFSGRFYPTSYRWDGFDTPEAVQDTEMGLWEKASEQPDGYAFFNGDAKTEHAAADPEYVNSRYFQNMTDEGGLLGFDIKNISKQLRKNDKDGNGLPDFISTNVVRTVAAVDGSLVLDTKGKGLAHPGDNNLNGLGTASKHVESGLSKMVAPDGLLWVKGSDSQALIVDEDSGNDYGERKYALPITDKMQLRDVLTGYLLGLAGGALNPRAIAGVSTMGGSFSKAGSSEFSGSWDVTHLVARKSDGTFYTKEDLAGSRGEDIKLGIPLGEHQFIGVVQHPGESAGQVAEQQADQGGQLFMFNMSGLFPSAQMIG